MTPRVIVLLRVPCSPVQAFDIFMQQIGAWWADSPLFHLTPRSPGKLAFEPPAPGYPGRLVEMLPNGKVFEIGPVHDWKPGGLSSSAGGWRRSGRGIQPKWRSGSSRWAPKTRVTVEHRGWDSVPQEHLARHGFPLALINQRQGEQWRAGLDRLRIRVSTPPSTAHD